MSQDEKPIEITDLRHNYGSRELYNGLNLTFEKGQVYALLGKNGVGKTSLIQILMGFMRPNSGVCKIFGDPAYAIRPETRQRVGLLFERHLAYDFFSIEQVEKFTRQFYPKWKPELYYDLVDRLGLPKSHRIAHMSEGQRSQVVLGLILAQDPELLILDDYSMGLDAGYRRLFVDYLCEHLKDGKHTIIVTSHVIQDMHRFVDQAVFMRRDKPAYATSLDDFMNKFSCYRLSYTQNEQYTKERCQSIDASTLLNVEWHKDYVELFTYAKQDALSQMLVDRGLDTGSLQHIPMDIEDAFVGFTGRY